MHFQIPSVAYTSPLILSSIFIRGRESLPKSLIYGVVGKKTTTDPAARESMFYLIQTFHVSSQLTEPGHSWWPFSFHITKIRPSSQRGAARPFLIRSILPDGSPWRSHLSIFPAAMEKCLFPHTIVLGALLVSFRALYSSLFCQLSVYILRPFFYWPSLLNDLLWLLKSKKISPLSDSIPSSAHSNLVSIWTTQLKLLFQITSDLQMGLIQMKHFCPQPRSQQQHPTQLTSRAWGGEPLQRDICLPCLPLLHNCYGTGSHGVRPWTLPIYHTLPRWPHWLGCQFTFILFTLLPRQQKKKNRKNKKNVLD